MRFARIFLIFFFVAGFFMGFSNASFGKEKRMKVIDFDDEVVEGMNKRPLDSLNYLSDQDKDRDRKKNR